MPSTTEKANPPKKAGYASAAGQMSTSAPSGFGQMLWIIFDGEPEKGPADGPDHGQSECTADASTPLFHGDLVPAGEVTL
jgi:hypothetical protein